MDILFVIAEAHPFAKTGGLGEVGGSLPAALNKEKNNVRVIMPKYRTIPQELRQQIKKINEFTVELGWRKQYCALEELVYSGVHYYFIDNEYYFNREKLYGYDDEAERFAFFCKAVLESMSRMDGFEAQIIHCNDWHTSLIPLMLQENYGDNDSFQNLKTVFTIHNLMFQGIFPHEVFDDVLGYKGNTSAWRKMEYNGNINYLKTALMTADIITTVSQTYALEIQDPQFGEGLNELSIIVEIAFLVCSTVLTPKDMTQDRSESGSKLPEFIKKKEENKRHLQEILNLPEQTM
jgi:starch synthase